jgi:hypothetical protein
LGFLSERRGFIIADLPVVAKAVANSIAGVAGVLIVAAARAALVWRGAAATVRPDSGT